VAQGPRPAVGEHSAVCGAVWPDEAKQPPSWRGSYRDHYARSPAARAVLKTAAPSRCKARFPRVLATPHPDTSAV